MTLKTVLASALIPVAGSCAAQEAVLTSEMLTPAGNAMFDAPGFMLPDLSDRLLLQADRTDSEARLLRLFANRGDVNGHRGVVYDNRDRGHSTLPQNAYPSLARLVYGSGLENSDFGLATKLRLPATVIGNSSTAVTSGPRPRSLPRLAMTTKGRARQIYSLYVNNHLYLYPEHRDHDDSDRFPANWPLTVTSQGSSGSDRTFVNAFLLSLAAMRPETMAFLTENGLIAPTLQMLLRRNLLGVDTEEAYFTAAAHPSAFEPQKVRTERMIGHAAALQPSQIAPMPRLEVEREDFRQSAGLSGRSERLFDTPVAISRLWRGFEGRKSMRVSAKQTQDPFGRALTFRWVLLRGDPARVSITPSSDTMTAEIRVDWHDEYVLPESVGARSTSRVDVGVFVATDAEVSAPAFISIDFPTHQQRIYAVEDDGPPLLVSVDYDAVQRRTAFDPVLYWTAPWKDIAIRNADGALVGWDRVGREVGIKIGEPAYTLIGKEGSLPTLVEASE